MTLSDFDEKVEMELPGISSQLGLTVRHLMIKCAEERRLICGVYDCANQLETDADQVVLCILPKIESKEVQVRIQHTLIQAYCRENNIGIIQIESGTGTTLNNVFKNTEVETCYWHITNGVRNAHAPLERKRSYARDLNCFLVKVADELSPEEKLLKTFCEKQTTTGIGPVVEIPS